MYVLAIIDESHTAGHIYLERWLPDSIYIIKISVYQFSLLVHGLFANFQWKTESQRNLQNLRIFEIC